MRTEGKRRGTEKRAVAGGSESPDGVREISIGKIVEVHYALSTLRSRIRLMPIGGVRIRVKR